MNETVETQHEPLDHSILRFVYGWEGIQRFVHETAKEKGWWDGGERNDGEIVALIHSEVSEVLEALRAGNPPSDHVPAISAVEEELADVLIRLMDWAEARGFDVPTALVEKMRFNAAREYKHGGKKF